MFQISDDEEESKQQVEALQVWTIKGILELGDQFQAAKVINQIAVDL